MAARIGCLGVLILWTLLGVYLQLSGQFGEEGGGKLALMGLAGVALFAIASVLDSMIGRLRRRKTSMEDRGR